MKAKLFGHDETAIGGRRRTAWGCRHSRLGLMRISGLPSRGGSGKVMLVEALAWREDRSSKGALTAAAHGRRGQQDVRFAMILRGTRRLLRITLLVILMPSRL